MKTAVTVTNTIQTGMDNYKDTKITKVFDDSATIREIKEWALNAGNKGLAPDKRTIEEVGLTTFELSDISE